MVEQSVCMKQLRAAAPQRAQYKMELGAQLAKRPQPSGRACTSGLSGREIAALRPGGGCGLLRLLAGAANSAFKIITRATACVPHADSETNSGPPPSPACNLPTVNKVEYTAKKHRQPQPAQIPAETVRTARKNAFCNKFVFASGFSYLCPPNRRCGARSIPFGPRAAGGLT